MGNPFKAVGDAVGGATSFLTGGKSIPKKTEVQSISGADQGRQDEVSNALQQMLGTQSSQSSNYDDLFKQHLTDFLNANNPNPTPEQMAQATSFVDQTFTQPMQNKLDQYNARFGDAQNAQAAALGRAPGSDQATQQAIYTSGLQNLYNLQAQRGANIQNTALGLNQQNFDRNAASSSFINNLAQQAMSNRMGLLNGLTGINQFNQRDRLSNITQSGGGTTSGLLTNLNAVQNGVSNVALGGSENARTFRNFIGGSGSGGGGGSDAEMGGSFSNYGNSGASGFNLSGAGGSFLKSGF